MKRAILQLFVPKPVNLSLKDIDKILKESGINMPLDELKDALNQLELDGIVYYNEEKDNYSTFPSNFFITKLKSVDPTHQTAQIMLQNQYITLFIPPNITNKKHKIIVSKKKNQSYRFIKSLTEPQKPCQYLAEITQIFRPETKGYTINSICKLLKNTEAKEEIKKIIQELEEENQIYFDDYTNKYYPISYDLLATNVISSKKGTLYIYNQEGKQIFLDNQTKANLLPNDTILIKIKNEKVTLVKLLKRKTTEVVCEVTENGLKVVGNATFKVNISKKELKRLNLSLGTRILVQIGTSTEHDAYIGKYLKTVGHVNDADAEFKAIAYNNGFVVDYSQEELDEINSIPTEIQDSERINRVDLTHENVFTIDGEHTKDFDDAVSIKKLENGNYELTVSIAHVNHYIKKGSLLWQRAQKNTTSIYMIDSVFHMLHQKISNGICSLNPGVERLTKSYQMIINEKGDILDFKIFDSIIKSKKQMTYEDVNQILEKNIIPPGYEPFIEDLLLMQELSQILTQKHIRDGAIDFDSSEIRFVLNDEKQIIGVEKIKQGTSEKLIENFMVITNEGLAEYMLNMGLTFIYRNHEIPFDDKVYETTKLIKNLGNKVERIKNADNPKLIQKLIKSLNNKEEFLVLSTLVLKSMQKAYFSPHNKGHYALAINAYSQTTSPIRRFLDLVIQHILDNLEDMYREDFDSKSFKRYIEEMCEHTNIMERNAEKAEYEADKLFMIDYCQKKPDQTYIAFIQTITPEYITIKTEELIEAIILIEDIENGSYYYDPSANSLINRQTHQRINIGSKLTVKLKSFNREFRELYFTGETFNNQLLTRKKDLTH